jgi:ribosomal protein L13
MQVAFAIQAAVDTSNSDVVKVFALEDDVKQIIPLKRIMQGQNFSDDETVTGVEVASHSYKAISQTIDVYDANESGTGKNIFVKFSEPLHDLSITNGEIVSRGTNYAVINANTGCVLRGQQYEHTTQTKRKNNPVVLASEIEKIVAVENATLISSNNIDNILAKCYNWLVRTNTTNLKIVEGKSKSEMARTSNVAKYGLFKYGSIKYGQKTAPSTIENQPINVGENIGAETEYLGIVNGRIIKQSFNLNGNIIIKEAVLK